jgi:hypothetical protein
MQLERPIFNPTPPRPTPPRSKTIEKRISSGSDGDEIDCVDKKCYLVHQLRQICVIPIPTNNTFCSIPCSMSGCEQETHRNIVCPIWLCKPFHTTTSTSTTTASTTTTLTTTSTTSSSTTSSTTQQSTTASTTQQSTTASTTTTTTSAPEPPLPVLCHSTLLYVSVGLNVLLIISVLALLFYLFKLKKENGQFERQIQRALHTEVNRFTGQVGNFSIESIENLLEETDRLLAESDERQPLLANRNQNTDPRVQAQVLQRSGSNESSVSDNTFLAHRADYMLMSTFKPETNMNRNQSVRQNVAETKL